MIAEAFAYVIGVTLLFGLAALSVERLLAEIGRPRRAAWLVAYAAALTFPPAALLLATGTPAVETVITTSAAAVTIPPSPFDWDMLLIRLWAATTGILLLAYVASWIRLAMLAKRWPRVGGDKPLVLIADDVGPAVLGIFKPRIVLPRWLMDSPASIRNTIMAHELEHIAARDQASIVAAQLVTVLLPWNLPLWWFARRLRSSIELDCDARVLRKGVDVGHYADVLLQVGQRRLSSPYAAATLIEPVTQLERRIRIMLTRRAPGAALRAGAAAALALAIAACVTRIEPPVVSVTPEPSADAVEAIAAVAEVPTPTSEPVPSPDASRTRPQLVASGSVVATVRQGQLNDWVTIEAPKLELRGADSTQMRTFTDRIVQTGDELELSNVKIELEGMSITAARAVTKKADDGTFTLTLDDAVLTRQEDTKP